MREARRLLATAIGCSLCVGCGLDTQGLLQPGLVDDAGKPPGEGGFQDQGNPPPGTCTSAHGPAMVPYGSSGGCIDSTEVTNVDYAAFLTAIEASGLPSEPAWCEFKTGVEPAFEWPYAKGADNLPVVWVDWCDARLYCLWANKRLCGGTGGGSNPTSGSADPTQSQWYDACSAGGTRAYPYGTNYDQTACFSNQPQNTSPVAVATYANCVGGYPGIFDMSGNAWEWEDSCDVYIGANDQCLIRGGGTSETGATLTCATKVAVARSDATGDRGFRCCSQ
jgi:formylglycine-generating enzyme required for sulfatase activity